MATTRDASLRLLNFYLDEADAVKLDKYLDANDLTRSEYIRSRIAEHIDAVELDEHDIAIVNANIQDRINKGFQKHYKSIERYKR